MWWITVISVTVFAATSSEIACGRENPEVRFLQNIDKLLNRSHVSILQGVTLRRKFENEARRNNVSCTSSNLIQELQDKLNHLLNSHVMEFDLAAVLSEGKSSTVQTILKTLVSSMSSQGTASSVS